MLSRDLLSWNLNMLSWESTGLGIYYVKDLLGRQFIESAIC